MSKIKFKTKNKEVNLDKGEEIKLEFPYKGNPNYLIKDEVAKACNCIADIEFEDNKISVKLTENSKGDDYPNPYNRAFTLFELDGKPLKRKNAKGVKVYNSNKTKHTFRIKIHTNED